MTKNSFGCWLNLYDCHILNKCYIPSTNHHSWNIPLFLCSCLSGENKKNSKHFYIRNFNVKIPISLFPPADQLTCCASAAVHTFTHNWQITFISKTAAYTNSAITHTHTHTHRCTKPTKLIWFIIICFIWKVSILSPDKGRKDRAIRSVVEQERRLEGTIAAQRGKWTGRCVDRETRKQTKIQNVATGGLEGVRGK